MSTPTSSLTVRKIIPCRPEVAFQAWTDPQKFQQWFAPDPTMTTVAKVDLRAGGKYQIGFQPSDGKPAMFVGGEFLAVIPPSRLEYTWIWERETDPDWQDRTVVTIDFNEMGADETEVVLTHAQFSKPDSCEHHNKGWVAILDRMAGAVGSKRAP